VIIDAAFVKSAASARDFPRDGLAEVALVGRSNVGKSSLINALVRRTIARTSAAPGKTRLANIYRVAPGGRTPFYLVDLPGYGYARGGARSAREFDQLTRSFFARVRQKADATAERGGRLRPDLAAAERGGRLQPDLAAAERGGRLQPDLAAFLLVDARHPGLASDLAAWRWLSTTVEHVALVATKVDKLTRGERIRALRAIESVHERPVLPVSAATGEGLDDLWKLIAQRPTSG
jgi:GTP-binding protein